MREVRQRHAARQAIISELTTTSIGDLTDEAARDRALRSQQALQEHDLLELRALAAARERMDSADFGRCENCQEPIEIARLFTLPEATRCYSCAAEAERRGRSYAQAAQSLGPMALGQTGGVR